MTETHITALFLSALFVLFPIHFCIPILPEDRLVNGIPISAHLYPWMVSLRSVVFVNETYVYSTGSFCGASLISLSPPVILTAAHCLQGYAYDPIDDTTKDSETGSSILIYADINRTYPNYLIDGDTFSTLSIDPSMFIVHEEYNHTAPVVHDDVALIVVDDHNGTMEPLPPIGNALPIIPHQLSADEACCVENEEFIAIGYGLNASDGFGTFSLESTVLSYLSERECGRDLLSIMYPNFTDPAAVDAYLDDWLVANHAIICVIGDNTDICSGDSGGPLIRQTESHTEIVGVVSYSYGDCNDGTHAAYMSTGHYHDWIYNSIDEYLEITGTPTTKQPTTTPAPVTGLTTTAVLVTDIRNTDVDGNTATRNGLFCVYVLCVSVTFSLFT